MAGHALLAPSAAYRWLQCTAAPRLEAQFPDEPSVFAEEGTRAHEIAARCLQDGIEKASELAPELDPERYPPEMLRFVTGYLDFVREQCAAAQHESPTPIEVLVETRVHFPDYVPEGAGTADAIIVGNRHARVIDLKYGQGVPVYAQNNPQLMLYGLGAFLHLDLFYDIDRITLIVYQPRRDHVSQWEVTVKDLLAWADSIRPVAQAAYTGEGAVFAPSEDACRFCAARFTCAARARQHLQEAKEMFDDDPLLLDLDDIGEILPQLPAIKAWIADMEAYALKQALAGERIPGHKLVEGRSVRRISDEEEAATRLLRAGFTHEQIVKPGTLYGITELQKLLGKKGFDELLSDLLDRPAGKPTLVVDTDPRPEFVARPSVDDVFSD